MTYRLTHRHFILLVYLTIGMPLIKGITLEALRDLVFADTNVKQLVQGAGKQYETAKYASKGEAGDKAYKQVEEFDKGLKGQHDKERQKKHFTIEGGKKNGYAHQKGYYEIDKKGAKGGRGYHYVDKGHHKKGHSIKGHHKVHKLDEYKKNKEFYDEDHDESFKESHGDFEAKKVLGAGGLDAGGHFRKLYFGEGYGIEGKFDKGSYLLDENGHRRAKGRDAFYTGDDKFDKQGGKDGFREFAFRRLIADHKF